MNSIERAWKTFLKEAISNGRWVVKDDGDEILEIMDNHCFIENIITSVMGRQKITLQLFLDLIGKGTFNIDGYPITDGALKGYVVQLDDLKQIDLDLNDNPFIYTYPERIYNIKQATRTGEVVNLNQVSVMVDRLKEHSGSNRAVANLYMCALDKDEQHIPCLQFLQCLIRDNELSLHLLFRSNDLYSAFPSNMLFLQYLGLKITEELQETYPSLTFKGIYYNSTSLHIYRGDYEQARRIIGE